MVSSFHTATANRLRSLSLSRGAQSCYAIGARGAYIGGKVHVFENKPPPQSGVMSTAEKGGAYFRENTVHEKSQLPIIDNRKYYGVPIIGTGCR